MISNTDNSYSPANHSFASVSRKNTLSKVAKLFGGSKSSINTTESDVRRTPHTPLMDSIPNGSTVGTGAISPAHSEAKKPQTSRHSSPSPIRTISNTFNNSGKSTISPASSSSSITSSISAISLSSTSPTTATTYSSKLRDHSNNIAGPAGSTISVNTNNNSAANLPQSSSALCGRFIIHDDGTHEHHLKNAKRQEKLTSMIKNMVGAQKIRGQAKSAVPDIMIDPKNNQQRVDPPTLFAGLMKQMANMNDSERENVPFSGASNGADKRWYKNGIADPITPTTSLDKKGSLCFAEKYGRCQEVLGKGAFGVVRICHKKNANASNANNREVLYAVKEFKKKASEPAAKYSKRLTSEFCISSSLRHTNIIMTFDLFQDAKGDYCEVMEYCAGGDLFTLIIAAGKLEYLEADCFFKQLIRGVVYMHEMGVCHRDLKPENLLLTSDGTLKIIDFGNSECFKMAWEKDIHLSGGVCGSSPYIAPEEYSQEEFDPRPVDIWACGVIYMAMRTGRQLWRMAQKDDEFFAKYLRGRKEKDGYEPIENLKRARCRNVIYSMLDPVPHRRINGKQILNSEWGREIKCCNDGHALK